MKKRVLQYIQLAMIVLMFSGCAAFHSGYMANSASLSSANFSYVRQNISGEATATYILGFGGFGKKTLVDTAKQNMILANSLNSNQALANITVNFKSSVYLGLFIRVRCTVAADLVEFK